MTIVEAIKTVLYQVPDGLTSKEIYDEIVKQNLYSFGAKNPLGVVNSQMGKSLSCLASARLKVQPAHGAFQKRKLRDTC